MRQKLIGRTFLSRGGNGTITPQQKKLWELLGEGWEMELPILTKNVKTLFKSLPPSYKVDIGNQEMKILIEIDGNSHKTKKWKFLDKRKTNVLNSLGWKVLRFWNEEVTTNPQICIQKIQEYMI
jgi:very-short-patch-repair endonuclease